jgi:predicted nucleic acid-binding protein
MKSAVFVDTSAWIAVSYAPDPLRPVVLNRLAELQRDKRALVTTSAVITEVLDGFASHRLRFLAIPFRARLRAIPHLEVVHVSEEIFERGWDLYASRPDKDWSLTDCVSFVVMSDRAMTNALAHDRHFEQAGFRALLREI